MYSGSFSLRNARSSSALDPSPSCGTTYATSCLSPGFILPRQNGAGPRLRACRDGRFDFPQFDPIAADFDLVIRPAQIFQYSVGAVASQVAAFIQPRFRDAAERIGQETLGGQLGPIEVATRHSGPADIELAYRAGWHRLQIQVEHI